jgi:hypothetical protein
MANWLHELGLFIFAVLTHWQSLVTGGIVIAAVNIYERKKKTTLPWQSYAFILGAFCLYSIFAAWQDEHHNTANAKTDKSTFASQASACAADLKAAKNSLEDKQSLVSTLQTAFTASQAPQEQQAANIASCITSLSKMNPKIREEIVVVPIPIASVNSKGMFVGSATLLKSYLTELIITTNETEPRFHGMLRCDNPFVPIGAPQLPMSSQTTIVTNAMPQRFSDREYEISVTDTGSEWSPARPGYLQVKTDEASPGSCSFTPDE